MKEVAFEFDGKAAIVTGGGSGMGAAMSRLLAASGARVAIVDIDRDAAERVAATLPEGRAIAVGADVSSEVDTARYVEAAVDAFGRVDLFANNAGILGHQGPIVDASVADFELVLGVNLRGAFLGLREVLRQMLEQGGGGAIVCTASTTALKGSPGVALYSTTKFALAGLTRAAAKEYGDKGIRVNAICPPATETNFSVIPEDYKELMMAQIPLGRLGKADDMAKAAVWLMSDGAAFVNGAILPVDGGLTA